MDRSWNGKNREAFIKEASSKEYDIVIIGGGVTGAGVAREAALRGLSFCILDKNDFAFGTSSRSSKLAHGGLRYLSSGELGLVRESTTERNWLMEHFPHQVRPLGFMVCCYEKGKNRPFKVRLGVRLYDLLSNTFSKYKNYRKAKIFSPAFVEEIEPCVTQYDPDLGKMKMAGFYYDTNIDDSRLTLESIKEGLHYSPESAALSYTEVTGFVKSPAGRINSAEVKDVFTGKKFTVKGGAFAACGGIWSDEINNRGGSGDMKIYPTKGVHVIVPAERLGNRNAFGISSFDDGRFFFILRRGNVSVIGTTDTDYYKESKNLDEPWCRKEDCDYLLNTVNRMFPRAGLTYRDIIGTYAGIRPLIKEENAKSESAVSRSHEIYESAEGLVTLAGGKLTTYRLMAEELIFFMARKSYIPRFTKKEHMKKGFSKVPFISGLARDDFYAGIRGRGLDKVCLPDQLEYFHTQYGQQAYVILAAISASPESGTPFIEGYPHCRAEINFILENEMALRLIDIMCRRTEAQWMVWHHKQRDLSKKVAAVMRKFYGWTAEREKDELEEYMDYVKKTIWF